MNLINGTLSAEGKAAYCAVNPATGTELRPSFRDATEEELRAAVQAADNASSRYADIDPGRRAQFLRRIAERIVALGDTLVERCVAETGLPAVRIVSERGRTAAQLTMFADLIDEGSWVEARIDRALPERQPQPRPDLRRMLRPLGPVAVFGASNFPLAFSVAGGDTASALAAGNAVVVKAHPSHPGTSELVGEAVRGAAAELDLPPGVFNLLHGQSHSVGMLLVQEGPLRAVGFTGSAAGGRALFDIAAARPQPIPVFAEMGSTNPVFLLPGALGRRDDSIAEGLAASTTLGVGQFCTKPGLVFGVESPEFSALIRAAASHLADIPAGTMLSAAICARYRDGVRRLSEAADEARANSTVVETGNTLGRPSAFVTTAARFLEQPWLQQEVFGPVTLFVQAGTRSELLQAAAVLEGQLTATIHGTEEDLQEYADLLVVLSRTAGRIICNGFPTGVEVCHAMHHGGPYPATTDARFTSVGSAAIARFVRPVCYQNTPDAALPPELQRANPRGILRVVDGSYTREPA
ncbi:MAG: aldehyde dehydrogenase (NADP(+)) [Spirochaetaceae bacterium]|nr:MAG: aldehyde dehydrogenase (NADP(+)) [Spirochaetaceae bacterium]